MKKKKKYIISIFNILLILLIIILLIYNIRTPKKLTLENIEKVEKEKTTRLIYIYNSEIKDNVDINKYLVKQKINYLIYDIKDKSKDEYQQILKTMHIDKNTIKLPAFIYLKDGYKYSYIIDIKEFKTVENFIQEYDLKNIK